MEEKLVTLVGTLRAAVIQMVKVDPKSREGDDIDSDATAALRELAILVLNHPQALNYRVIRPYFDFESVTEVVRQFPGSTDITDLGTAFKKLLSMKYETGTRAGRPVLFGVHARIVDHSCLLTVNCGWGIALALEREFLSISGFTEWLCFEIEHDVALWLRGDPSYVVPHCSVMDLTAFHKKQVISELQKRLFTSSPPMSPFFADWVAGRVANEQAAFTEQCCLFLKRMSVVFRDWLKSHQHRAGMKHEELVSAWNAHQKRPKFWADVWKSVFETDRATRTLVDADSAPIVHTLADLIDAYQAEVSVIKMEAIKLAYAITNPNCRPTWDDLESVFVKESCNVFNEDCYLWFRDCMRVVTSREQEFATYFLLFDDALGPNLPPPDESPEQRRKLYMPFRLGLAPDGFWRVARTFEVSGKKPDEVVELVENKLVSIDELSVLSPLDFIDNSPDPMDHTILANNLALDLLKHLKILALFGTPKYFQIFFQSKRREPLLNYLKRSINQENFLGILIKQLPAEGEDIVPHVDHIKAIAAHEKLMANGLQWVEKPNAPVKCVQTWQTLLRETDFGKGWVGLPCVRAAEFLETLGMPGGKYRHGWIRLGCFVYKKNVRKMKLSQTESFEAFIRGVGFCDERSVLIPVCGVLKTDEVISASCMLEIFRWGEVIPRNGGSSRASTRPPKRPKLRHD